MAGRIFPSGWGLWMRGVTSFSHTISLRWKR